jgi:predicted Zn-dependent protease
MLEQQKSSIPTMAGILAGIVLAATGNADAGMAAITATQAAALDSRLRYSRSYEQEADRVGFETMVKAGRDPKAAGDMFEVMLRRSRFDRRPPEFLSTHPVSESRIADARNRAMRFSDAEVHLDSLDFQIVAARVKLHSEKTAQQAIKRFETEISGHTFTSEESREANRYGLVLALTEAGETDRAREELARLQQTRPNYIIYQLAGAAIERKDKNYKIALKDLNNLLGKNPNDHAITIQFAETLMEAGEYRFAEQLLATYARKRPTDDYVWYLLAEVYGLVGNILEVHRARAEYYILNGIYDRAMHQLENAQRLTKDDKMVAALVDQRLIDVREMMEEADI